MKIKLNNVRLSFPSLFRKGTFAGEETKYEATFLLNKTEQKDLIEQIQKGIAELISTELKGAKLPADKICLKDGDTFEYDGYAGHYSIKASSQKRPIVLNRDKSPLTEDDNIIYPGCYVNAIIDLWAQNNSWGKRINASLLGVQFAKDGEPFGDGSGASADDFDFVDADVDMQF